MAPANAGRSSRGEPVVLGPAWLPSALAEHDVVKKMILIVFISGWAFMMLSFSGLYDNHRTALAWHRYNDAPSETTRREIRDAKSLDRREILLWEVALGTVLIWPVIAVFRLSKKES